MSLYIYISSPDLKTKTCECPHCNNSHETSYYECIRDFSITHNLGRMAVAAGVYNCVWRPEEIGIEIAEQMIEPLKEGIKNLKDEPESYKAFNPENAWGSYEEFIKFLIEYLNECEKNPKAMIKVCR